MVSSPFFTELLYLVKEKPQGGSKGFVEGLRCREFGRKYDVSPISVCEFDFGALEVIYCCDEIKERLTVEKIMRKPKTMWRNA
jgi:threonine synthase